MLIVEKSENILGCSLPVPQPERARVHIPTRGSFKGDILLEVKDCVRLARIRSGSAAWRLCGHLLAGPDSSTRIDRMSKWKEKKLIYSDEDPDDFCPT